MSQHNYVGKLGEDLARKFLEDKGYKILEQNYKTKFAEIDLVVEKIEEAPWWKKSSEKNISTLVFVEVRTKIGEQFGSPEDTINHAKLQKVLWNSKNYIGFKRWQGACRIDAICIVLKPLRPSSGQADFSVSRLTHHENIVF